MSRHLLDLNVVLAILDARHAFHDAVHRWIAALPDLIFLTCPVVQNGVVRVARQAAYPNALGTAGEVRSVLADFCADPRHEFCPDDISLLDSRHFSPTASLPPSRVSDLYLLAFARHHGVRLATFDRRIPSEAIPEGTFHLTVIPA